MRNGSTDPRPSAARAAGLLGRLRALPIAEVPRGVLTLILCVEALALACVVAAVLLGAAPTGGELICAGLLVVAGAAHTEIASGLLHRSLRTTSSVFVNLTSVWVFAAALLVPPAVAVGVVAVLYTHVWLRVGRPRVPYHRHLYTMATVVLAALAAAGTAAVVHTPFDLGRLDVVGIAAAMGVFLVVNTGLVAAAIAASTSRPTLAGLVGDWNDNALEVSTLCLGALCALAYSTDPVLALFTLPPLAVLHRSVRVPQLERQATVDGKTGLLNAGAWHRGAELALSGRRGSAQGLLVLDLDHFKRVNDTYGHLVGDDVLRAVATAVTHQVRERDLVGRFGGEEFVVLLTELRGGSSELVSIAERVRSAVAEITLEVITPDGPLTVSGLTTSVGAVLAEAGGPVPELRDLIDAADSAVYAAKRGGRDQVRVASPGDVSPERAAAVLPTQQSATVETADTGVAARRL